VLLPITSIINWLVEQMANQVHKFNNRTNYTWAEIYSVQLMFLKLSI